MSPPQPCPFSLPFSLVFKRQSKTNKIAWTMYSI
jgi:hypothetical protein